MNHITLAADFSIEAAGESGKPTFSLVAYTGAEIRQAWSRSPLVVDLAGMNTDKASIPILWSHDRSLDGVIGKSTEIVNSGDSLTISGELMADGAISERIIRLAKAGIPLQASIGADAGRIENVAAGSSVTVNGREFTGPVSIVRASDLRETSVVLFGADANTSVAIAAEATDDEEKAMSDPLNETPVADENPHTDATANVAVEQPSEPAPAEQVTAEAVAQIVLERLRNDRLQEVRASRPAGPAIHVAERVEGPSVVEAALCLAGGLANVEKHFDARTVEAAEKRRRTTSLGEVLVEAARTKGYTGSGRITAGNIREVLASAFATHSISNVLAATYGKFLLQGYNAVESTWDMVASVRSVSDYKTVTGIRLNGGFEFEDVGPSGALKSADASDETRTIRAKLTGRMSSITMVDIVNDDLGALTQVPSRLGRGAAIKLNKDFWAEFESSNSTFYKKATAAAGNALSIDALKTAVSGYRKLTDPDGNVLGITPSLLLVPPELEMTAEELMGSSVLITGSDTVRGNVNVFAGRFRVVQSAYLTSSSTWWLCANPGELPAMEVAFLNGQRTPTVEQAEADFSTLGIQVRGHFSYGVAKAESRGAYRMATA